MITPLRDIARRVRADGPLPAWRPRYNQPPGEPIPIALQQEGGRRRIEPIHWGLASKTSPRAYVNVTAERLSAAKSFTKQRGLFFVDGFYEWDRKTKQPYYIYARNRHPIPLAVIYRRAQETASCAVITTPPNELVGKIHDRMPAVVPDSAWDAWLDPEVTDSQVLGAILRPADAAWFRAHPAPTTVNSPKNDVPALIEPDPAGVARQQAERIAAVRRTFERREFTTGDVALELGVSEDEAEEVLQAMWGEIDRRLAKWWFRKWQR